MVAGNTEIGVETKFKHCDYPVLVSAAAIRELHALGFVSDGALLIGGAVTLASIEHFLENVLKEQPPELNRGFKAMLDMIHWFASAQIRNAAALAGNIVTASPISGLNPVLMALGASVVLCAAGATLREVLVRDFFESYHVVDMQPGEVLCSVEPWSSMKRLARVRRFPPNKPTILRIQCDLHPSCTPKGIAPNGAMGTNDMLEWLYSGVPWEKYGEAHALRDAHLALFKTIEERCKLRAREVEGPSRGASSSGAAPPSS